MPTNNKFSKGASNKDEQSNNRKDVGSEANSSRHKGDTTLPFDPLTIDISAKEVAEDTDIGSKTASLLKGMSFPAYKQQIVDHLKSLRKDRDNVFVINDTSRILEMIERRLDPYEAYSSVDDVLRVAVVTEMPEAYAKNLMSKKARTGGNFAVRSTAANKSQKEKEAPRIEEEREDYPEVPPSARMEFGCDICGVTYSTSLEMKTHIDSVHGSSARMPGSRPDNPYSDFT